MDFVPQWALGVGVILIAISVGRALAGGLGGGRGKRIGRREAPSEEVAELRQSLEATQNRLGEVEERLDFAERLLAKQRDVEPLAKPPGSL